ncbi:hypothetical protein HNQ39_004547 [Armatimonas rosea]|uniref:Uncharacterized protein n=1 Tax=Armatimonas rosea TaxID=685828 RepID=A0A7W9W8X9_ARMRO|nr:hypothetical protein [Armatimonas rosea]
MNITFPRSRAAKAARWCGKTHKWASLFHTLPSAGFSLPAETAGRFSRPAVMPQETPQ